MEVILKQGEQVLVLGGVHWVSGTGRRAWNQARVSPGEPSTKGKWEFSQAKLKWKSRL